MNDNCLQSNFLHQYQRTTIAIIVFGLIKHQDGLKYSPVFNQVRMIATMMGQITKKKHYINGNNMYNSMGEIDNESLEEEGEPIFLVLDQALQ